ncbi:G2/mitotic-specific cyclin [Tulasnella sp. 417]|nr:G2/mitotic-specific cyclin [Tulasnella sp. 417]
MDRGKNNDLLPNSEYSEDIYRHLQHIETTRMPRQRFMDSLPEQAWRARALVVDSLLLLHRQLELLSETFWMAINLFDRLLSLRNIPVKRYQFTGLVCTSLAAKSQETIPRRVNWWELSSDDGDDADKFLAGELMACQQLEWRLECPNPLSFLRRISVFDDSDVISFRLAKYLVLMQCFDPHLLEYRSSLIAASAYWLTRISLRRFNWPENLYNATGYRKDELLPAATCMVRYLCNPVKLENFFYLFASTPRLKASEFFHDWARSHWEEGSRLNAGLEAELPFLMEEKDDSWRELYPFEEWIEQEQKRDS